MEILNSTILSPSGIPSSTSGVRSAKASNEIHKQTLDKAAIQTGLLPYWHHYDDRPRKPFTSWALSLS